MIVQRTRPQRIESRARVPTHGLHDSRTRANIYTQIRICSTQRVVAAFYSRRCSYCEKNAKYAVVVVLKRVDRALQHTARRDGKKLCVTMHGCTVKCFLTTREVLPLGLYVYRYIYTVRVRVQPRTCVHSFSLLRSFSGMSAVCV